MQFDRKEVLENALLELMKNRPYEQITVKELTDYCHISRKTFYQYFSNKHECLESLTDRMLLEESTHLMRELPEDAEFYQIHEATLLYWMDRREFLGAIIAHDLGTFFLERYATYVQREGSSLMDRLDTAKLEWDVDILLFGLSGVVTLLLFWCSEGFVRPLDEMTRKLTRLLHEPLLGV